MLNVLQSLLYTIVYVTCRWLGSLSRRYYLRCIDHIYKCATLQKLTAHLIIPVISFQHVNTNIATVIGLAHLLNMKKISL